MSKKISPILYFFGTIVGLAFAFYILEASFLAREGMIEDAAIVAFASITLFFFLVYYSITVLLVNQKTISAKLPMPDNPNITKSSISFTLGFIFFSIILFLSKLKEFSFLEFTILKSGATIFSQAGDILGSQTFKGIFMNTVAAPFIEEIIFFFVGPVLVSVFLLELAKNYNFLSFFKKDFYQFLVYAPLMALLFASFHIGQTGLTTFFISAMIFRLIILGLGYDSRKNIFNGVFIGLMFAIGGHMANNIILSGGIINWIKIMSSPEFSNFTEFFIGYGILGLVFSMFLIAGTSVFIKNKKNKN
ncbi:MAG: hypothetical protein ACOC3Z_03195 [Nanoarchaeota archaeon]